MRQFDLDTFVRVKLRSFAHEILARRGLTPPPEDSEGYGKWRLASLIAAFDGHYGASLMWPYEKTVWMEEPLAAPLTTPLTTPLFEAVAARDEAAAEAADKHRTLTVRLKYFKKSGKFYDEGELEVPCGVELHHIWEFVEQLSKFGQLPGLISGGRGQYNILVEVPEHPNAHPHLIMCASSDQP